IVGYRMDEKAPLKADVNDLRFAFAPCYARVGNQLVAASRMELCRELIDILQKEQKNPPAGKPSAGNVTSRGFGAGAADVLAKFEDELVTQAILDQAVSPREAREQVKRLIELVRGVGTVDFGTTYLDREFRYELRLKKKQ